jgi:hypothetical protein
MSQLLTTAEEYDDPTKYKLALYRPDEVGDPIYEFNSFNVSNVPFDLVEIGVDLAMGQNGGFMFRINDTKDKVIKDSIDCGYVVQIFAGKKEAEYKRIMWGIIDGITDEYPAGEQIFYTFKGSGFGIINNYTILSLIESANKEDILGSQPVLTDPRFRIDNLMIKTYESTDVLPELNSKTLKARGNFDTSALPNSCKVVTPAVDASYSTAANIFENFSAAGGVVLWIDPDKKVIVRAPYVKHSGITIRPWEINPMTGTPMPDRLNDNANSTSYYYGGWSSDRQMVVGEFFNKVFITINTDEIVNSAPGENTVNYTSLANKDIGMQFRPGSSRLFNISLLLSKTGTGRSTVDNAYDLTGVQGLICKDDGNNKPSNKIVATFNIPYDQIDTTPTPIYKMDLQFQVSNIEGNDLHWILLFKRGETEESTIQWYHDSDFVTDTTTDVPRYSATKTPFTKQPTPFNTGFADGWSPDSHGPAYRYSFFATAKTTLAIADPTSIAKYTPGRPIEVRVNAPWINDVRTGVRYANSLLQYGAKLKRVFSKKQVSIPTGMFFPFQLVNIIYPIAGISQNANLMAEINSVHYGANAYDESNPFGSYTVDLTAIGYVNHYQKNLTGSLVCTA